MLTDAQRSAFERTGIVKLERAFAASDAARMCDVVWNELRGRYGIEREDPTTWDLHPPTGLRSSKRSRAFDPICASLVSGALDDLLGPGRWDRPEQYGNVLVTMPNASEWRVPHRVWHADFESTYPGDSLFAVKVWALCSDVAAHGGGTPQLAGSHRLFARYLADCQDRAYKPAKEGFLRSHPWLKELSTDDAGDPGRNERFMAADVDIDGIPARVVELTGKAGDAFITHPWVFHSIAVNARNHPRVMRSVAVRRRPPTARRRADTRRSPVTRFMATDVHASEDVHLPN